VHPGYDGRVAGYPNDIAVLEPADSFDIKSREVAVLATKGMDALYSAPQTCAVVTGWGKTEAGKTAARLTRVFVPVRAHDECKRAYKQRQISAQHLCAGYDSGQMDSCEGDSGGPLMVSGGPYGWVQLGVVSWGEGCAKAGFYGVYQRVGHSQEWIDAVIAAAEERE
jgi:trypsin